MGNLQKYALADEQTTVIILAKPVIVSNVINYFNIKPGEIGLVLLNNKYVDVEALIPPGSEVKLFPILAGG